MPRASVPRQRKLNTKRCSICGIKVAHARDVERHNLLHADNVAELKTRCPYPGCSHKSLQKSNVAHHTLRQHGVKMYYCSATRCTYSSLDEASVMEHQEQVHKLDPGFKIKQRRRRPCPSPRTKTEPTTPSERQTTTPDITTNARPMPSSPPVLTTINQVTPQATSSTDHRGGFTYPEIVREGYQPEQYLHPIGPSVPSNPDWPQWGACRETLVKDFTMDSFFQGQEQSGGPQCTSLPQLWDGPLPQTLPWSPHPQETTTPFARSKNEVVEPDAVLHHPSSSSPPSFIDVHSQNLPAFNSLEFARIMESWNDVTVSLEAVPGFVYDTVVDPFFSTSPPIMDPLVGFGLC